MHNATTTIAATTAHYIRHYTAIAATVTIAAGKFTSQWLHDHPEEIADIKGKITSAAIIALAVAAIAVLCLAIASFAAGKFTRRALEWGIEKWQRESILIQYEGTHDRLIEIPETKTTEPKLTPPTDATQAMTDELKKLSIRELKGMAKGKIKGYSKMKKAEIAHAIAEYMHPQGT